MQAQGEQLPVDIRSKFLTEAERQHIDALLLTNRSIVGAIGKMTGETKRRQRGICILHYYFMILGAHTYGVELTMRQLKTIEHEHYQKDNAPLRKHSALRRTDNIYTNWHHDRSHYILAQEQALRQRYNGVVDTNVRYKCECVVHIQFAEDNKTHADNIPSIATTRIRYTHPEQYVSAYILLFILFNLI